jgi:hypothetical protein
MKDFFNHFELKVKCLCVPEDFKKNRDKLKDVDVFASHTDHASSKACKRVRLCCG